MPQPVLQITDATRSGTSPLVADRLEDRRAEREIINGSRRKRIARSSGTTVRKVNNLLRQYAQMRKMFKSMGSGGGLKAQQRMMSQMQGTQRFGK